MSAQPSGDAGEPVLRVVRGEPTAEELAAVVAVLLAARAATDPVSRRGHRSAWSRPATRLRLPPRPGSGAWRRSGLPG